MKRLQNNINMLSLNLKSKGISKHPAKYLAMTALALTPYLSNGQTTFDYQDSIPGFNMFEQTNIGLPKSGPGSLKYYGSGDVNNDGVINKKDVQAIYDGTKNDMADVNGDGVVDSADAQMLQNYINGTRSYLPGHWNEISALTGANSDGISKRYAARVDWIKKMLKIDKTDTNKYALGKFDCTEFSIELQINFSGIQNFQHFVDPNGIDSAEYVKHGAINNIFNIPTYSLFSFVNPNKALYQTQTDPDGHFTNLFLVGSKDPNVKDNPKDLSQYLLIEPQNDSIIKFDGSSAQIDPNKPVIIEREMYIPDYTGTWGFQNNQLVEFNLSGGNPTLKQINSYMILENPALMNPKVNMQNPVNQVSTTDSTSTGIESAIDQATGNVTATATTDYYQNKVKLNEWESDTVYGSPGSGIKYTFKKNFQAEVDLGKEPPKSATTSLEVVVKYNTTGVNDHKALSDKYGIQKVWPNPFMQGKGNNLFFDYRAKASGPVEIDFIDLSGRRVMTYTKQVEVGINRIEISVQNINPGTYLLNCGGQRVKVVVQ